MSYRPNLFKTILHKSRRTIASLWLSLQPALQIAITGSQGKTNTTQIISKIAQEKGSTVVTDLNLDTIYNVPITALKVTPWTKYAVFELGIDKPGEMDMHLQIVKPKIAVVTGVSPVHTDKEHLGTFENLIKEKQKLVEALPKNGYAILNWDDEYVRGMASHTQAKILWFGTDLEHCNVWCDQTKLSLEGTETKLHDGKQMFTVHTYLIGKHHIYNIMAGYLISKIIKLNVNDFLEVVHNLKPLKGRGSVESGPLGTVILNDSLRANPTSTAFGLNTLSEIPYTKGRKIAVLAEMGELEKPEEEHRKIGELIAKLPIDYLVAIGPMQKFVAEEAMKNGMSKDLVSAVKDVFEAADVLKNIVKENDLIYLKGSLLRHVERVLLILGEKQVGCHAIVCPFYHHCSQCEYLKKGYR